MNKISLALFGKIHKMFASIQTDKFLSFNPSAIPYEADTFKKDIHSETNAPLKASIFVNATSRDQYIWSAYKETLEHLETAHSDWTLDDFDEFQQKVDRLTALEGNYNKYEKEYEDLVTEKNGEEIALGSLTDSIKIAERNARIAELNVEISDKMFEWKTKGQKLIYEHLANEIRDAQPQYPSGVIQKYKSDLDAAEIGGDAASGQMVYSTSYSPSDFFEENGSGWIHFELDKEEVDEMYDYALKTVFAEHGNPFGNSHDDDELEIERIKGEIGNLKILRAWLNPNFFHANYWRLPSLFQNEFLSDGKAKNPAGRLPAYVENVLFIKKLDIELQPNSTVNEKTLEKNANQNTPIQLGNFFFKVPESKKTNLLNISKPTKINHKLAFEYRKIALQARKNDLRWAQMPSYVKNQQIFSNFNQFSKATNLNLNYTSKMTISTAIIAPKLNIKDQYAVNTNVLVRPKVQYGFEGFIKSEESGQPLKDVQVVFTNIVTRKKKYVVTTDERGYYKAILPGDTYDLEIDHPGFFRETDRLRFARRGRTLIKKLDFDLKTNPESTIEDEYSFACLGFLCKKLPKSPNPNVDLNWG